MPGLPSTVSETESPTGCTKQLISVTSRIPDPAAELIRPPGMNPSSSAFEERAPPTPPDRPPPPPAPARHVAAPPAPHPARRGRAPAPWRISPAGRRGLPPARAAAKARAVRRGSGLFIGARSAGRDRKSRISCGDGRLRYLALDRHAGNNLAPSEALRRRRRHRGFDLLAGRPHGRAPRGRPRSRALPRHPHVAEARPRRSPTAARSTGSSRASSSPASASSASSRAAARTASSAAPSASTRDVVRTVPQPRRPFQGWRYLRPEDAPRDLMSAAAGDVPPELAAELALIGVL